MLKMAYAADVDIAYAMLASADDVMLSDTLPLLLYIAYAFADYADIIFRYFLCH